MKTFGFYRAICIMMLRQTYKIMLSNVLFLMFVFLISFINRGDRIGGEFIYGVYMIENESILFLLLFIIHNLIIFVFVSRINDMSNMAKVKEWCFRLRDIRTINQIMVKSGYTVIALLLLTETMVVVLLGLLLDINMIMCLSGQILLWVVFALFLNIMLLASNFHDYIPLVCFLLYILIQIVPKTAISNSNILNNHLYIGIFAYICLTWATYRYHLYLADL